MAYVIKIGDINGVPIAEIPAKNLQYSFRLNDIGNVDFTLPVRHPKCTYDLLTPAKRTILVYRNDALIWGGYLWTAQADLQDGSIRFGGADWFSILMTRRYISDPFARNQDQLLTAWDLINYTQTKKTLNITQFAPGQTSGIKRIVNYIASDRKFIGEAIQDLATSKDGFDFELTPNRVWKVYYPSKGTSLDDITLELGKNVRTFTGDWDGGSVVNELTGIGSTTDSSAPLLDIESDAISQGEYGLLQGTATFDTTRIQVLQARTREALRIRKFVLIRPGVFIFPTDPPFGSYSIGDTVNVVLEYGQYVNINAPYRISTIAIQVADSGAETIQLEFQDQLE